VKNRQRYRWQASHLDREGCALFRERLNVFEPPITRSHTHVGARNEVRARSVIAMDAEAMVLFYYWLAFRLSL
jgi:hypothetical protein